MRSFVLCVVMILTATVAVITQTPAPSPTPIPPAATIPNTIPASGYVRPDKKARVRHYVKNIVGFEAIGANVAAAGFSTWTNSPKEWGTHWDGFGKRFASNMGKDLVNNTTLFALEEAFKLDSRYYRSTKKDMSSRIKSALLGPFTARDETGRKVFGFPRIAGTYTANIVAAEAWYPKRYGLKDGLKSATISLGSSVFFDFVKEFIRK